MTEECTLRDLPSGRRARIRSLTGRSCDRSRLCALGFTPGTEIEVSACCGGLRVRLRNSCVVLDSDLAQSIVCVQTPQPEAAASCCCGKRGRHRHHE